MARTLDPEKREKLLSAALRLFVTQGVQGTSTAEIAKEAGTAAGTLFLYFPTKQNLLDELILKIAADQAANTTALMQSANTARECFWIIWESSLRWFMAHPEAYQYVQQVRDTGMISPTAVAESGGYFGYYYAAIQKGLEEGSIQPYPAELIGGVIYQHIVAVTNLVRAQPEPAQQEQYIQQGFEIFWNGIKREPGQPGGSQAG